MGRWLIILSALFLMSMEAKGQGLFGTEQIISTKEDDVTNIHPADLDGDGDMDVLYSYSWAGEIGWHRNDGVGEFVEDHIVFTDARGVGFIRTADLDGDGDLDLIVGFNNVDVSRDEKIVWYKNDGDGSFGDITIVSTTAENPTDIDPVDLDEDGDLDLLVSSEIHNKVAWYENEGNGNFSSEIVLSTLAMSVQSVDAADLDRDGDLDVLSASPKVDKIAWHENNGNTIFSDEIYIAGNANGTSSVITADVDGDGHIDVVSNLVNDNKISWYKNDGNGNFVLELPVAENILNPKSIDVADLDADGDVDVLVGSDFYLEEKIVWYENDGNGHFSIHEVDVFVGNIDIVSTADLDGDGDLDVLTASYESSKIAWYENTLELTMQVFDNNEPCTGLDNGSLQVVLLGGGSNLVPPYTYTWSLNNGESTGTGSSQTENFTIDGLATGTYNITVTNANLDTAFVHNYVLGVLPGSFFEIVDIQTTNSVNELPNGSIQVSVIGSSPDFTYTWTGEAFGTETSSERVFDIPFLYAGTYEVTVKDKDGNTTAKTITLLDETFPVDNCERPLDVVILNDVSGSVDEDEYRESQDFFVDFVQSLNIGTGVNDSRAAIVEWASHDEQFLRVPITGILSNLGGYRFMNRVVEGGTHPQEALKYGHDYLANEARPNAVKILVLSTDAGQGEISGSLIALSKQYQAEGYVVITIAFDDAYTNAYTRSLLSQVASVPILAPGAASYSELDQELASLIVNLYVCPTDPGSSNSYYFNRDGALDITDYMPINACPNPEYIEVTYTVAAQQQLSLPPGTSITFYYNDPSLASATPILTTIIPCAIPAGTSETFTITLPVTHSASIFGVLNDDGSQSTPINFPITDISEVVYSNNIDNISVCIDPIPTLSASKYTTTPKPVCGNMVIYTIDICNISEEDATGVVVTDQAAMGFVLEDTNNNLNNCATANSDGSYDIPAGCCVSITYQYNVANAESGDYNNQGASLSGPENQVYQNFNGANTSAENVTIGEGIDCDSDLVTFQKSVNTTQICDESFVTYTFTIDNQTNVPLQGLQFRDQLPTPVIWAAEPYLLEGLSIGATQIMGSHLATFTIAEIAPNTTASFSMDAYLGNWSASNTLSNTALLSGLPNFVNGNGADLSSSSENVEVTARPEITLSPSIQIKPTETAYLVSGASDSDEILWTSTGDGTFDNPTSNTTNYTPGANDLLQESVALNVHIQNDCGETQGSVEIIIREFACNIPPPPSVDSETLYICQGMSNHQLFALTLPEQTEIAWFETETSSNPIAYGAETLFSNVGTYYASAYSVLEEDTCFSSRIALDIEEVVLTASNNGNFSVEFGEIVELSAQASSSVPNAEFSVEWTGGNNLNDYFTETPIAIPYETSNYTATFTDGFGCQISTELTIIVKGVQEDFIAMPTAFSPNNDGVNDYFQPVQASFIETVRLSVYNRWGKRVFYSEENAPKWDGIYQSTLQEIGTYVYVYEYLRPDKQEVQILQGNVTLIH